MKTARGKAGLLSAGLAAAGIAPSVLFRAFNLNTLVADRGSELVAAISAVISRIRITSLNLNV